MEQDLSDSGIFVLMELHEFMSQLFRSLPMKTLNTCARVCKKWHKWTKREKQSRQKPLWLFYDHSKGSISRNLEEPILNSRIEPHLAMVFLSSALHDCKLRVPARSVAVTSRHPRAAKHEKKDFMDYLSRLLPKSCKTLGIITDGIVGTTESNILREMESTAAASVLILPKLPDFHLCPFALSSSQAEEVFTEENPLGAKEDLLRLLNVPDGLSPKIILTFHGDAMFESSFSLEKSVLNHFDGKVIIAGGFTDHLVPEEIKGEGMEDTLLTGLTLCSSHVQMAATVLDHTVQTEEEAENVISQLKRTNISCDWAFALMFACVGRGHYHYNSENAETKAFRKVFPTLPVFGFFGNGEVGHNFLPNYASQDYEDYSVLEKSDMLGEMVYPKVNHAYTTVFVVVSRLINSQISQDSCSSAAS